MRLRLDSKLIRLYGFLPARCCIPGTSPDTVTSMIGHSMSTYPADYHHAWQLVFYNFISELFYV